MDNSQIELSNFEEPVQDMLKFFSLPTFFNKTQNFRLELAPNEYVGYDDKIGFLPSEVEPYSFLSVESKELTESDSEQNDSTAKYVDSFNYLPKIEIEMILSDKQRTFERKAYSFFTAFGDFGGFNGALFMFPAFLMSFYTPRMFQSAVYSEMPVRKHRAKPA